MIRAHHVSTRRQALAGLAAVGALLCAGLGQSSAALTADQSAPPHSALGPTTAITLVTGDVLRVRQSPDGRLAVGFEASVEDPRAYLQYADAAGDFHVVPARLRRCCPIGSTRGCST